MVTTNASTYKEELSHLVDNPLASQHDLDAQIKSLAKKHNRKTSHVSNDYAIIYKARQTAKQEVRALLHPMDELAEAKEKAGNLLTHRDILSDVVHTAKALGHVGNEHLVKLVFLVLCTRFFNRICSLVIWGPSTAGKSYTLMTVLRLLPESSYHLLTSLSTAVLTRFGEDELSHKMLILIEADPLKNDNKIAHLMRTLLSENKLHYLTQYADPHSGKWTKELLKVNGPIGLITTTCSSSIESQLGNRVLSVRSDDSREQTKRINLAAAAEEDRDPVDLEPWDAFQLFLELGPKGVTIPYRAFLANEFSVFALRSRRDFPQVLVLIRAHALLHQETRGRDERGRIVAEPQDYAAVYELLAASLAEETEVAVSERVRTICEAVQAMNANPKAASRTPSVSQLATSLSMERSTCSRAVNRAIQQGYLCNLEWNDRKPARLQVGSPLPAGNGSVMPEPRKVREWWDFNYKPMHLGEEASSTNGTVCSAYATTPPHHNYMLSQHINVTRASVQASEVQRPSISVIGQLRLLSSEQLPPRDLLHFYKINPSILCHQEFAGKECKDALA